MSGNRLRALGRWLLIVFILTGLGAAGWWGYHRFTRPSVVVTDVVRAPVVEAFYATGTLTPEREYPIRTHVEGTITELCVDKGDAVTRGMVLARVRDEARQMRFRQAQADFELARQMAADPDSPALQEFDARITSARQRVDIAQRETDRLQAMQREQAATQTDLDQAQDRLEIARSLAESLAAQRAARKLELQRDLDVARAALEIAQWNLDEQTLISPSDGVVLDRPTPLGTRLKINDDLMRVADTAPRRLVMRAAVDEEDRTHLAVGQQTKVTMYAYPRQVFQGEVERIYPQADAQRRTFEADVRLLQPHAGFAAGMTGELAFVVAQRDDALVVPTQAVIGDKVWVLEGGAVRQVSVQVGLRSIERVEVAGIEAGQLVVISASAALRAGLAVRGSRMEPAAAAGLNTPAPQQAGEFRGFN